MSIKARKNTVRRYQGINNSNNLDTLNDVVPEDLRTPKITAGIPTGIEGPKTAHGSILTGFPDYQTMIDDLFAEGDKMAAPTMMKDIHQGAFMGIPPTGKHVSFTGVYMARIENGKIAEHWREEDGFSLLQPLEVLSI